MSMHEDVSRREAHAHWPMTEINRMEPIFKGDLPRIRKHDAYQALVRGIVAVPANA